jgi:hypothetical protein
MNSQEMVIPLVSLEFHCDGDQVDANIGDYNETNLISKQKLFPGEKY